MTNTMADLEDRVIMAVVKTSGLDEHWISIHRNDGAGGYLLRLVNQEAGSAYWDHAPYATETAWHHVHVAATNATTTAIYIDGVAQSVTSVGSPTTPTGLTDVYIGSFLYNTSNVYTPFNGEIDEARMSNSVRSATWIEGEFNTSEPSTFYSRSSQETSGRRRIAILN